MELVTKPVGFGPEIGTGRRAVELDDHAARRTLRGQIAHLEDQLARAFVEASPHVELQRTPLHRGGPRLLSLAELVGTRDVLINRLACTRAAITERAEFEAENRRRFERMLLEPGRHKFVRIANEDLGERGCGVWEVRPRLGLVGMLMGWWRVKLSSGCPLAEGHGTRRCPAPKP